MAAFFRNEKEESHSSESTFHLAVDALSRIEFQKLPSD